MTSDYQRFMKTYTTFEREFQVHRIPGDDFQPDDITVTFHRIQDVLNKAYIVLSNHIGRDGEIHQWEGHADYIIPYEFPLVNVYLEAERDQTGKGRVLLGAIHFKEETFPLLEEIARRFELKVNKPFRDDDGGSGIVDILKSAYASPTDKK